MYIFIYVYQITSTTEKGVGEYIYRYLYINIYIIYISDYFYNKHTTTILEALAEKPTAGVKVWGGGNPLGLGMHCSILLFASPPSSLYPRAFAIQSCDLPSMPRRYSQEGE